MTRTHDHLHTALNQGPISQLGQCRLLDSSVSKNLCELHEHVAPGDPHVGELDPAIVDVVPSLIPEKEEEIRE